MLSTRPVFRLCPALQKHRGTAMRCQATADATRMEHCARQLYEVAWSKGEVDALNGVMSDSHSQRDILHPGASSEGRQGIQQGITRFREGDRAGMIQFSINEIACDEEKQRATVEWKAALEEQDRELLGVSVLQFEEGMIAETRVYRQSN